MCRELLSNEGIFRLVTHTRPVLEEVVQEKLYLFSLGKLDCTAISRPLLFLQSFLHPHPSSGPSQWRDQLTPSELLEHFVRVKNIPLPEISEDGNKATFMDRTFFLSDFGESLNILPQRGGRQRT